MQTESNRGDCVMEYLREPWHSPHFPVDPPSEKFFSRKSGMRVTL